MEESLDLAIASLSHPSVDVRTVALHHLWRRRSLETAAFKAVRLAIERFGGEAFAFLEGGGQFTLDDEDVEFLSRAFPDSTPELENVLSHIARCAPLSALKLILPERLQGRGHNVEFLAALADCAAKSAEATWEEIRAWKAKSRAETEVPLPLRAACERLGRDPAAQDYLGPALEMFRQAVAVWRPEDRSLELEAACTLLGGLRIESAVDGLLEVLAQDAGDYANEAIEWSLRNLAGPAAVESLVSWRDKLVNGTILYAESVLHCVHDSVTPAVQNIFEHSPHDCDFVLKELAWQLEPAAIALATEMVQRFPRERADSWWIAGDILYQFKIVCAAADVLGIDLPKKDVWERDIDRIWKQNPVRAMIRAAEEELEEESAAWTAPSVPETIVSTTPRVGRNDPCPCGSGKKFKKCCLGKSTQIN